MEPDEPIYNDPGLDGRYLGTISSDFVKVADFIKEASYQIRVQGFSEYPIFPISKTSQPIGKLLYGQNDLGLKWEYYASYLDEFIQRKIIDADKSQDFIRSYKDPDEFCCMFVIDRDFMNFVYIPYPED
jgi:hypothetical protein